jgi:hypothetical protein
VERRGVILELGGDLSGSGGAERLLRVGCWMAGVCGGFTAPPGFSSADGRPRQRL